MVTFAIEIFNRKFHFLCSKSNFNMASQFSVNPCNESIIQYLIWNGIGNYKNGSFHFQLEIKFWNLSWFPNLYFKIEIRNSDLFFVLIWPKTFRGESHIGFCTQCIIMTQGRWPPPHPLPYKSSQEFRQTWKFSRKYLKYLYSP